MTDLLIWLNSGDLIERADALDEVLSGGFAVPLYADDGCEIIEAIHVTESGREYLPIPLRSGEA